MSENEIKEFVSKSIKQVKSALPKGYVIDGKLDFDISVITSKETSGKIDIQLAGVGRNSNTQQLHRLRFSIADSKSQKKALQDGIIMLRTLVQELAKLEEKQNVKPKKIIDVKKIEKNTKIRR